MFHPFMKVQQDRKEKLEIMFPESIIKGFSLSLLEEDSAYFRYPIF